MPLAEEGQLCTLNAHKNYNVGSLKRKSALFFFLFFFPLKFPQDFSSLRVRNGQKLVTEKYLSQFCLADGQEQDAIDRAVGDIACEVTTAEYIKTR